MQIKLLLPLFIATGLMADTFILNSSAANFDTPEPLERDNKKEIVYDPNTNLMWQDDKTSKTTKKNWQGAKKHCENLKFGSFDDWRLPTIVELKSIVDYNKDDLAIINGFKHVTSFGYWSSSPVISDSSCSWFMNFSFGYDGDGNNWITKSVSNFVRCVRDSKDD